MGAAPLRVHIVLLASRICRSHATAGPALVRRRRDLPEADSNGVVITRSNGGAIPGSHFDVDVGGHLYGLSSHQTQHCAEQSLRATRPSRECEAVEGASKETIGDSAVAQTALLEGAVPATIKGMLDIDLLHPNATPPALQILVLLLHFSSNAAQDSLRKDAV
jgi:hypothetical protein